MQSTTIIYPNVLDKIISLYFPQLIHLNHHQATPRIIIISFSKVFPITYLVNTLKTKFRVTKTAQKKSK